MNTTPLAPTSEDVHHGGIRPGRNPLPEITLSLWDLVPPGYRHYFSGSPRPGHFSARRYDFGHSPQLMPLVRAFLDTCAAERDREYRYLFTLLGTELANNALKHSASGRPGGTYTLVCHRRRDGFTLTCRDNGAPAHRSHPRGERVHLKASPGGLDPASESGRGLALVDALSTSWGDNGFVSHRKVWFFLANDLSGSSWGRL